MIDQREREREKGDACQNESFSLPTETTTKGFGP